MHCSYRLKFFVVRDHLWDGNSLTQLQSPWLCSTRGSPRSKYTEGVARRIATRSSRSVRGGPTLFISLRRVWLVVQTSVQWQSDRATVMLKLYLWTFSYLLVLLGWVLTSFLPPLTPPLVNYGAHVVAVAI